MNNYIQSTNISPLKYVDQSSRYAQAKVEYYITDNFKYITFSTYQKTQIPSSPNDVFTILDKKYEYRPDKLANDVYSDPRLWWKIMEANSIKDIFEFKAGINIRIPALVV